MLSQDYLASIRRRHRAEALLVLIRLEPLCPDWWPSLAALAQELRLDRNALVRGLLELERHGLVRRCGRTNLGLWVWWVKRHECDRPREEDAPHWLVRDVLDSGRRPTRVPVEELNAWGADRGIPRKTINSWMAGRHRMLRQRWEIVAAPRIPSHVKDYET